MGVTGLWPILSPVKQHQPLKALEGQTLAVDLSIWVVENQAVPRLQGRVQKPHLRNLFFRISTLLQLGVKLIFVIEGEAPEVKQGEIERRIQARRGAKSSAAYATRPCNRSHFKSLLKECCELLEAMGVPYLQGQGEAESLCAALSAAGLVDACISDDNDCFLYGATVVYRNFTLDTKDPHVESYSMKDISSTLGLDRERLVALALLLGCDYFPAGVPGVGEVGAMKLLSSLSAVSILGRFHEWKKMNEADCIDSFETSVWRKAGLLPNFPPQQVITEFLMPKEKLPLKLGSWNRPNIMKMIALGTAYLEWPEQYSLEKILPLLTLWDQLDIISNSSTCTYLHPCRIVKKRRRQGVLCFEVKWENNIKGLVDASGVARELATIEQGERFQACYPSLVQTYFSELQSLTTKQPKKTRKPKAKDSVDALAKQIESLNLGSQSDFDSRTKDMTSSVKNIRHIQPSIVLYTGVSKAECSASKQSLCDRNCINQAKDVVKEKKQGISNLVLNWSDESESEELHSKDKSLDEDSDIVFLGSSNSSCRYTDSEVQSWVDKQPAENQDTCTVNAKFQTCLQPLSNERLKLDVASCVSLPQIDLSALETASFVGDGHFTLHHSLFCNLAESDVSGDEADINLDVPLLQRLKLKSGDKLKILDS